MLEFAEDMAIDVPKIYTYLGELISPMVEDGSIPLGFLKSACEPLIRCNKAGKLVAEVLHDASNRLVSICYILRIKTFPINYIGSEHQYLLSEMPVGGMWLDVSTKLGGRLNFSIQSNPSNFQVDMANGQLSQCNRAALSSLLSASVSSLVLALLVFRINERTFCEAKHET